MEGEWMAEWMAELMAEWMAEWNRLDAISGRRNSGVHGTRRLCMAASWSLRPTRPGPATGTKVCSFPTRGLSHRLSIGSREVCVGRFSRAESARLDGNLMQLRNACVGIGVGDICTCRHLGGDIALVLMAPFHTPLHRRPRKQKRSFFLFSGTGVLASAGK